MLFCDIPPKLHSIGDTFFNTIKILFPKNFLNSNNVVRTLHRLLETSTILFLFQLDLVYPGYKIENHYLKTTDGYILNIHRLSKQSIQRSSDKVVYLQHGILASSSDWIIAGPKKSLGKGFSHLVQEKSSNYRSIAMKFSLFHFLYV